jgi:large subunit ribosomal protein L4
MLALALSRRLSVLKARTASSPFSIGAARALMSAWSTTHNSPDNNNNNNKFHHLCVGAPAVTKCCCTYYSTSAVAQQSSNSSSSAAAPAAKSVVLRRIPSNLTFDTDSSFAPQAINAKSKSFKKKKVKKQQIPTSPSPASLKEEENDKKKEEEDDEKKTNKEDSDSDSDDNEAYDDNDDEYDSEEEDELFLPPRDVQYAIPLPERLHVPIHTLFAPQYESQVGTIWLNANVFGRTPIRIDLLQQAVVYFRNKKRGMRKAVTKTIAQVSGSGRKLRPQKGQGMARVGHRRPPHFRGGAKAHGPKNTTDYGKTKLNKKVRRLALCHALSQKLLEGNLILWNQLHELPTHKTSELARLLEPWQMGGRRGSSVLILDHYHNEDENDEKENDEQDDKKDDSNAEKDSADSKTTTTKTNTKTTSTKKSKSYNAVPTNLWVAATNLNRVKVGSDHVASVYDILKHEKLVLTLAAMQQLESRLKNV